MSYTFPIQTSSNLQMQQRYLVNNGFSTVTSLATTNNQTIVYSSSNFTNLNLATLSNLLSNYVETPITSINSCTNIVLDYKQTQNIDWFRICTWTFPGLASGDYKNLYISSSLQSLSNNSYSIRVLDYNNNKLLCSNTFSNTSNVVNSISFDSTLLPFNFTTLELHAKVSNSNAQLTINNISCVY